MAKKKSTSPKGPTKKAPKRSSSRSTKKADQPSLKVVDRPSDFKGIEGLVFVEASSLKDHPDNWKTHTRRQLEALDAEFESVGWVLPLAYNLETGRLLDGHGRKRTDHVRKNKIVPVVLGHWKPEEEDQILLHLDPVGGMFETDGPKFRALMDRHKQTVEETISTINEDHKEAIEHVNESLEIHNDSLDYGAPSSFLPDYRMYDEDAASSILGTTDTRKDVVKMEESEEYMPGMYDLKLFSELPFNCFGEGGPFNIPHLRPDALTSVPSNLQTWVGPETPEGDIYFYIYGCAAIEKVRSNKLVVAYYTHDHKFESIWNDPRKFTARMINFNVHSVITPNYSAWEGCPLWYEIYQIARSRWLGRYWQETGKLKVIPDMALSNLDNEDRLKLRVAGLPQELPCIAIQVQQKGEANPEGFYGRRKANLLKLLRLIKPQQILLYRGPDLPKHWTKGIPKGIEVIEVRSWMWERGKILKDKEYLQGQ